MISTNDRVSSRTRAWASPEAVRVLRRLMRVALYLWVLLLACPIRYSALESGTDATWRFALNYAKAHGLAMGRDIAYTCGPWVYLIFPENVGSNLEQGLLFQAGLWLVLAVILADVFIRGDFQVRNLTLFSFCFSLATPLFWFSVLGPENLILVGAFILLVMFQLRGGWARLTGALMLIGLLPLFKLSGAVVGLGALAGFLIERAITRRWRALPELAYVAIAPVAIAGALLWLVLPSGPAFLRFLRASVEIISGYASAMTVPGPTIELLFGVEALVVLGAFLWFQAASPHRLARFYSLLIVLPLFISFKHGFVRQDIHITAYFSFVAFALAIASLAPSLHGNSAVRAVLLLAMFGLVWQATVLSRFGPSAIAQAIGVSEARMFFGALRFGRLQQLLDSSGAAFPNDARLEPEVIKIIGDSSVASLSVNWTNLAAAGLRLSLYPTLQRAQAYTPFLDQWNASWIRENGPRFLVFDGKSIDNRDSWAETPAMWLEIYRWYDTRLLGSRNLLLERRAHPRFGALELIANLRLDVLRELSIPISRDPVFWTMKCGYNTTGKLQELLFRVPPVSISVHETTGVTRVARVIPEVLVSPVLGTYLPGTLSQFAEVFSPGARPGYSVDRIRLDGPGTAAYAHTCEVQLLRLSISDESH
jgi:hypothetical protein